MAETNTAAPDSEKPKVEETQDDVQAKVEEDKWLIRECDLYYDEYKECTSFRGRFQQYFVYGDTLDCNQWKKDYDNCSKWEENKDFKAALAVINSEKNRRMERLRAHYRNDTWEKRDSPPEDWAKPLPDWMVKRDENTYLALKAKELREGKVEETKSSCSIM
ncbi:synaptic plasticity regulator PANTS [Anticarsia gemmatalis]|uniref:synaptic plasticity regulator PANTS n=1 Tax=Anticarsia gemmatalis TaxID=129554 RepID=UPI003F75800C